MQALDRWHDYPPFALQVLFGGAHIPAESALALRRLRGAPGGRRTLLTAAAESSWKTFDVRASGISLVATCRSSFSEEVLDHGIDGLIASLSARNRSRAPPA